MATKFMTVENTIKSTKEVKTTKFNKFLSMCGDVREGDISSPSDFSNVLYLGKIGQLGHAFRAWDNNINDGTIYFGEKGDEFND